MDLDPTNNSLLDALMETLQSHESETLRQLLELVFNAVMKSEREKVKKRKNRLVLDLQTRD